MAEKKTEAKAEASAATLEGDAPEVPDYGEIDPEHPGAGLTPFASRKVLWAKQLDGTFSIGGKSGEPGDFFTIDSDGETGVITSEDLTRQYAPLSEAKRLTAGSGTVNVH